MLVVLDTHVGAVIIISGILSRSSICFILLLILEIFIYFNLVYQRNRVESEVKLAYERKQWTERILEIYPSRPAHSRTFTQNSLPDTNGKGPSLLGTMYQWASNLSPSSGPFHLLEDLSSLTLSASASILVPHPFSFGEKQTGQSLWSSIELWYQQITSAQRLNLTTLTPAATRQIVASSKNKPYFITIDLVLFI